MAERGSSSLAARLESRDARRRAEAEARQAEAGRHRAEAEDVAALVGRVKAALAAAAARLTPPAGADPGEVAGELEGAGRDLQAAEEEVARGAYFLPAFEVRSLTEGVKEAKARLAEAKARLQPRKKFSFSRKAKKKPAPAPAPGAAAPGDGTAGEAKENLAPQEAPKAVVKAGHGLQGRRGEEVTLAGEELAGKDVTLDDLADCTVDLPGPVSALRLRNLTRCTVRVAAVEGPTFVDVVEGCTLSIASRQVRIHRCTDTTFYFRVKSRPIIEDSAGVRVAPYNLEWPGRDEVLLGCGLDEDSGLWREVDDFGWIKAVQSPNWDVLPEAEREVPELSGW